MKKTLVILAILVLAGVVYAGQRYNPYTERWETTNPDPYDSWVKAWRTRPPGCIPTWNPKTYTYDCGPGYTAPPEEDEEYERQRERWNSQFEDHDPDRALREYYEMNEPDKLPQYDPYYW